MSEYREESIRRKLVRRRIDEVRAVNNTKKRTGASGLLCISNVDVGPNGILTKLRQTHASK